MRFRLPQVGEKRRNLGRVELQQRSLTPATKRGHSPLCEQSASCVKNVTSPGYTQLLISALLYSFLSHRTERRLSTVTCHCRVADVRARALCVHRIRHQHLSRVCSIINPPSVLLHCSLLLPTHPSFIQHRVSLPPTSRQCVCLCVCVC